MGIGLAFAMVLASAQSPSAFTAAPIKPGDAFVDRNHEHLACSLASVIAAIHAVPPPREGKVRDRFVVLATDDAQAYVQCLFQDHDTWMICEASSGWYATEHLTLSADQRTRLAVLGFDTLETKGNFQQAVKTADDDALRRTAALMLKTSKDVYVSPHDKAFEVYAPLLGDDTQAILNAHCQDTDDPR